jgi:hypothetical protein
VDIVETEAEVDTDEVLLLEVVAIVVDHQVEAEVDIVETEAEVDTDEVLLLEVVAIVGIHMPLEVVDMMELDQKVETELHVHLVVMREDMLLDLLVEKEVKVDIADIVIEDEIVHIIHMKEEDHMAHNDLQNSLSSLNFGKFITSRFFMPRRLLTTKIKDIFFLAHRKPILQKFMDLHISIRVVVGVFFILFGILGILTPIPAGLVFVILGVSLIIGLEAARRLTIRFIHFTRLHILYGKLYVWWKRR